MTEIKIPLPEMDQIIRNQEKIIQMLSKLAETPTYIPKYDEGKLMTAPDAMHYLHCGRKKLNELVEQGKIERFDSFGAIPRYKILMDIKAA